MTRDGRFPLATTLNMIAMLAFSVLNRLLGLVSIATVSRLLTPAELGTFAFVQTTGQTFVGLLRLGALQGLHVSLARRLAAPDPRDLGELVGCGTILVAAIALLGALAMIPAAGPIARVVFGQPELAPFVAVAAVFFAGQFLSRGAYAGYAGFDRFVEYSRIATVVGLVTLLAVVSGAAFHGVTGAAWALALTNLAAAPLYFLGLLRVMRAEGVRIRLSMRRRHLRQVFAIGLPFYGAGVFVIPAEFASQGAVSRFGGIGELGELRVVLALMAVVQLVPHAIAGPMTSLLSGHEGRAKGAGAASAFEHMRWLWILALLAGAALAAVWPVAVVVVFGDGFPQARSIGHLAIVAFVPAIVGTALSAGILVGGRALPLLVVGCIQSAVLIGLALPLVEAYGLPGFFAAQAAAGTLAVILWLVSLTRQTGLPAWRPWMAPLLAITAVLFAALLADAAIDETLAERSVAGVLLVATVTLAVAFGALSASDRRTLHLRVSDVRSHWRRRALPARSGPPA